MSLVPPELVGFARIPTALVFGPEGFSVLGADLANFSKLFGSDLANLLGLIW
jgi:hypothetical protein